MRRLAVLLAAVVLAGCGDGDKAETKIRDATEDVRSGGKKAVDRADEALKKLDETDLPEDAKKELREAKKLLEEAQE